MNKELKKSLYEFYLEFVVIYIWLVILVMFNLWAQEKMAKSTHAWSNASAEPTNERCSLLFWWRYQPKLKITEIYESK